MNRAEVEKIVEKVRKLMAHQQSAEKIGSAEEAAAFAEKIQQLMEEYNIGLDQLEVVGNVAEKSDFDLFMLPWLKRVPTWAGGIVHWLAKTNFCVPVLSHDLTSVMVFGTAANRSVVVALSHYLVAYAEASCRQAAHRSLEWLMGTATVKREFRRSYLNSFAVAVVERLRPPVTEVGLVVVGKHAKANAEAMEEAGCKVVKWTKTTKGSGSRDGVAAGSRDGNAVSLAKNVVSAKAEPKQVAQ